MYRIDDPSASTTLPTPEAAATEGFWTEGNPGTDTPATLERASWFYMVQEELRAIVVAGGLTPSKTTYTQVYQAIQKIIGTQKGASARRLLEAWLSRQGLRRSSSVIGKMKWTNPMRWSKTV